MARHKMVDGVRMPLTAEEETLRDAEEALWESGTFDRAIAGLRENRTRLLGSTDWLALQDVTLSDDMRDYRQSLRDLPEGLVSVSDVDGVIWPVNPE